LRAPVPRFVGRIERQKVVWSGSTIEARFEGSGIALRLRVGTPPAGRSGESPLYTVKVDDESPRLLPVTPGEERYVLGEKLNPGQPHTVVVTRETEAFAGAHDFLGLELLPGGELRPLPREREARREIEIIGDSITCGYGILGEDASCKFSFATERASSAYGASTGRALDVDVATVCWSGRGVYRNYDEVDEPTMPQLWKPVRPPKRLPSAVVVHLGTNDVLTPNGGPFNPRAFEQAYVTFLDRIRDAYPKPWILVAVSPMLEGPSREIAVSSLERIVARRRSDGEARLEVVTFEEQGKRVGCDSHPNKEMHEVMARQLTEALRGKLD